MNWFKLLWLMLWALTFAANGYANTSIAEIEKKYNVRIGVYAIDTNNSNTFSYRQDESFPLQSTMKLLVAAAALKSIKSGALSDEKIKIYADDIVSWSPIVSYFLAQGYMTIEELAQAAMSYSDNAAANILIKKIGGAASINKFARSISNMSFDLENIEPNLNSNPDSLHDTATPHDMAQSIQKLMLKNNILSQENQQKLKVWMVNNTTGYTKIRAGLPAGWHAAEKTGSSAVIANDIGIVWSFACKPIVIVIYTISNKKDNNKQDESIAKTTKLILNEFSKDNACFAVTDFK